MKPTVLSQCNPLDLRTLTLAHGGPCAPRYAAIEARQADVSRAKLAKTSFTPVGNEADLVVAASVRFIRGSDVHSIRLGLGLGDRLSDPAVGARLISTTKPVVGVRILHAPREI